MEFLNHLWQSAILLSMFYMVYVLLLRKDTLFVAKRHFFIGGILVALLFPFVEITQTIYMEAPVLERIAMPLDTTPFEASGPVAVTETQSWDWPLILLGIYALGVFVLLVRLGVQCFSLIQLIRSYPVVKRGKYRFVQVSESLSPFSFFQYIVYNPEMHTREELEMILQHEKVHVSQWHSLDLLMGNLIQILQWANPFSWLYKRSMEENLEFIADGKTVDQVASKTQYQLTMVKASASWKAPSLTIQFYQSFIKKRIVMLNKQHSKKRNALKSFIVLPLLALFLWGFNVKQVVQYQEPEVEQEVKTEASEETESVRSQVEEERPVLARRIAPESNVAEVADNSLEQEEEIELAEVEEVAETEVSEAYENGSEPVIASVPMTQSRVAQVAQFRYRIHKDITDGELKIMKDELREEHGIDLSYTLVRNGNGEITNINMNYTGNGRNGSYSISEDDDTGITEFEFYMLDDGETGFYSEAMRQRREERMKERMEEMEVRNRERMERREEELKERLEEQERRLVERSEEMKERTETLARERREERKARSEEMKIRSKELKERQKEIREEMKDRRKDMRDRSRSVARSKSRDNLRVYSNDGNYVVINKNTTNAELEQMKSDLAAKGVTFTFKKVKRNSRGEINSIKVEVKDGNGRSQTSIRSDTDNPIEDIVIEY
ncbi:M56 family metallopeptidase [Aureisphaera galaxeae]|uniref:M56 family metallopeptidase n=1 Tax=Aureisphaera galaxeae TaxID=1538023 RepID=UPI0023506F24|nr:M56 family metallopeptidase [Aureisphaera galaxeae]MDC8006186.1 M56 family metallopeptidase [Aureisphaera galaxeae]